jgi:CheY-like chemotaxis protein
MVYAQGATTLPMQNVTSGLDALSQVLANFKTSGKPKMLVVDDEPDNLDLLYRTFRRDFQVLKAENGMAALEILEREGEVAVIISDQRMPEMKGTEFLSRTVPQYPYTMRIILTGFTDVEDLVDAINSGQVYKYITKPWDREELQSVVRRATETYELYKQRAEEVERAHSQASLLKSLVQITREFANCEEFLQATASAMRSGFDADVCRMTLLKNAQLTVTDCAPGFVEEGGWNPEEPLGSQAIAQRDMQGVLQPDPAVSASPGVQTYVVTPLVVQDEALALLSLGWKQTCPLDPNDLPVLYFAAQQIALTLNYTHCHSG